MKTYIFLFLFALLAVSLVEARTHSHHRHHSKTADHERQRLADVVNAANSTWTASISSRFQGKPLNYVKKFLGVLDVNPPAWKRPQLKIHTGFDIAALPESFDSRDQWPNCPTIQEVRDQSDCGSCWAFGAVEAASDRICIGTNGAVNAHLSATDLLGCCTSCGYGCQGGDPGSAWQYLAFTGVVTGGNYNDESLCVQYPFPQCEHHNNHTTYPACGSSEYSTPSCPTKCDSASTYKTPYSQDKHVFASAYSVSSDPVQIQTEIMKNGPIEVAFSVYSDFELYSSGVYQHVSGSYLGGHAVKIIGWGVDRSSGSPVPYWTVANSWNQDWGEKGFFRILRGSDECGIEDYGVAGLYKKQ